MESKKSILRELEAKYFFKYMSINQYLYESISNQTLWFSSYLKFNDPFEAKKPIAHGSDEATIENFLRMSIDNNGINESNNYVLKKIAEWKENPMIVEKEIKSDIERQFCNLGICCFSEIKDDILMWSHYANGHKGVCLEFDISNELLFKDTYNPNNIYPYKINYPVDNTFQKLFDPSILPEESLLGYLVTKSNRWQYEQELRIFGQCGTRKFNHNCLSAIYFGTSVDKDQKKAIINICSKIYPNINFYQMSINENEYKLNIPINSINYES